MRVLFALPALSLVFYPSRLLGFGSHDSVSRLGHRHHDQQQRPCSLGRCCYVCTFVYSERKRVSWNEHSRKCTRNRRESSLASARQDEDEESQQTKSTDKLSSDEIEAKNENAIGNLIANDEWDGLGMELSELVRAAVVEELKSNAREFLGKDDYKIGDISKELDTRVKKEVANMRNKEEYELGDFVLAMDEAAKSVTNEFTGKENNESYQFGDMSKELGQRIRKVVADFCSGTQDNDDGYEYELGDISREISRRVQHRIQEYTGKDHYEFGDISRQINKRRKEWIQNYLGSDAAERYQVGDISKKAISQFTGKEKYQFGDISKTIAKKLFSGKKSKTVSETATSKDEKEE